MAQGKSLIYWCAQVVFILTTAFPLQFFPGSKIGLLAAVTAEIQYACNEASGENSYAFCNKSLTVEDRVANLVSSLNRDEKIGLLVNQASGVPRLNIPSYEWWNEGLHGVAYSPGVNFGGPLYSATSFPQPILTAASFNSTLFNKIAQVVSVEARAFYNLGQAGLTYWTPNINLFRDPRWGRGQETPGEDPYLTSIYSEYFVRGLQEGVDYYEPAGQSPPANLKLSACCKHFTAYDLDAWEGVERYGFDAVVSSQDLDDSFNPPFQACIQNGQASGLMCSYNAVNGVPTCADPNLLTTLARDNWGFDGYIVSDCDAVMTIFANHHYSDAQGSVADAVKAGVDVNCGNTLLNYTGLALDEGLLSLDDVDQGLTRSFKVLFRLGLFDGNPLNGAYGTLGEADVCSEEHQSLALQAALQSIVLLKNENDTLPFSQEKIQTLAIIGPNANDTLNTMLGNYAGNPCQYVTPWQGLIRYARTALYSAGCSDTACETADIGGASAAATEADATVIVVGLGLDQEREAFDRTDLFLPGKQQDLVMEVAASATGPVVLVVMSGGCVDIRFARDNPKITAVLWVGYPGQTGGDALAQILYGDANPGGKLPTTWYPAEFTSWPMTTMAMRPDTSSGYPGRSYRFYTGETVYDFGEGKSYNKIVHSFDRAKTNTRSNITLTAPTPAQLICGGSSPPKNCLADDINFCANMKFQVDLLIHSSGGRGGSDVVLLYVSPPNPGEGGQPLKQLAAFQRLDVNGDGTTGIALTVDPCNRFPTELGSNGQRLFLQGEHTLTVNDQLQSELPIVINFIQQA